MAGLPPIVGARPAILSKSLRAKKGTSDAASTPPEQSAAPHHSFDPGVAPSRSRFELAAVPWSTSQSGGYRCAAPGQLVSNQERRVVRPDSGPRLVLPDRYRKQDLPDNCDHRRKVQAAADGNGL